MLAFCFLIGSGVAFYSPAWQASISEQVPPEHLPAAVSARRGELQHSRAVSGQRWVA